MGSAALFAAIAGATGVLALVAVLLLRRPLARMLAELCGSRARAAFWVELSGLVTVLAVLLGATVGPAEVPVARRALVQLVGALAGLVASLVALGLVLLVLIRSYERRAAPLPPR